MPGNFVFEGFEPSSDLMTYSKEIFWLIEDKSPSQSAKSAVLKRNSGSYEAHVKISSASGIFEASATNENPENCIEDVYLKVKSLMRTWAKNRLPEIID